MCLPAMLHVDASFNQLGWFTASLCWFGPAFVALGVFGGVFRCSPPELRQSQLCTFLTPSCIGPRAGCHILHQSGLKQFDYSAAARDAATLKFLSLTTNE